MTNRVWIAVAATVLAVAVAVGVGVTAYQMGLDQNVTVQVAETANDGVVVVGGGHGWRGGFSPFGFLFPLLFFFLIFGLFRSMWWGGRGWRSGPPGAGHGPWERHLDEWHRDTHARSEGDVEQNR